MSARCSGLRGRCPLTRASLAAVLGLVSLQCQPASVMRDAGVEGVDAGMPVDAQTERTVTDATATGDRERDAGPNPDRGTLDAASSDVPVADRAAMDSALPDVSVPDRSAADAAPARICPPTGALDCSPGAGTGNGDQCWDGVSCYYNQVRSAVNGTINGNSSWFQHSDTYSCEIVLDVESYMNAVVAWLANDGLCAIRDPNAPGEEITVKHDNAFSENFDILASTGCARSGAATYTGYCAPAWW